MVVVGRGGGAAGLSAEVEEGWDVARVVLFYSFRGWRFWVWRCRLV